MKYVSTLNEKDSVLPEIQATWGELLSRGEYQVNWQRGGMPEEAVYEKVSFMLWARVDLNMEHYFFYFFIEV